MDKELNNGNESNIEELQGNQERMFSQEEVNQIIKTRLERERAKQNSTLDENLEKRLKDLESRESAFKARESRYDCLEYLQAKGYDPELADILDTSDAESFKKKIDRLACYTGGRRITPPPASHEPSGSGYDDPIRQAFAPDRKHKPRKWPPQ